MQTNIMGVVLVPSSLLSMSESQPGFSVRMPKCNSPAPTPTVKSRPTRTGSTCIWTAIAFFLSCLYLNNKKTTPLMWKAEAMKFLVLKIILLSSIVCSKVGQECKSRVRYAQSRPIHSYNYFGLSQLSMSCELVSLRLMKNWVCKSFSQLER